MRVKIAIIGGGIVGLAVARLLRRSYPDKSLVVLEKESAVAAHQTGHNSGVLHTGIYYKPDSYKVKNCSRGKALMEGFCIENDVPFETCCKVIVATEPSQIPGLEKIQERGNDLGW